MFHQFENTKWLVARNPCGGERSRSLARKSKTVFTTFRGVSLLLHSSFVLLLLVLPFGPSAREFLPSTVNSSRLAWDDGRPIIFYFLHHPMQRIIRLLLIEHSP